MTTRRGLFCRYPEGCEACFQSDGSVSGIALAAEERDAHEMALHGYHHQVGVPIEFSRHGRHDDGRDRPAPPGGIGRLSSGGRSTLSLRKTGKYT